jgi:frataxin-like iron-binding protein CyaY
MGNCDCTFNMELDRDHQPWCRSRSDRERIRLLREAVSDQIDKKMDIAQKWAESMVELAGARMQIACLEKERDMLGRESDRLARDYSEQLDQMNHLRDTLAEIQGAMTIAMEDGADAQTLYLAVKKAMNGGTLCACTHMDDEHGPYGCAEDCPCEVLSRQ